MKRLLLLTILALFTSCGAPQPKANPEHVGVHPELQYYVDEFKELAAQRGIFFKREVTVGFQTIKPGSVTSTIGVCTYGPKWREIDIDTKFWSEEGELRKKTLVFHELVHCYCTRSHTYGEKADQQYLNALFQKLFGKLNVQVKEGFLEDGCPSTIMYPLIVSDQCIWTHYDYYIEEMFNQCRPW